MSSTPSRPPFRTFAVLRIPTDCFALRTSSQIFATAIAPSSIAMKRIPASRKAVFLTRYVEQPFFLSSLGELGSGVRAASRRLSALQSGYVREYALALAAGLAVLAIVFILVT